MAESLGGECDIVVIGGGPGGYPAAFEAADHGKSVILVDEDARLGGVCANRGCIPSKALLHVAKLLHEAKEAEHWGVSFGKPKVNLDKLRDYKNKVVEGLTGGIGQLAAARKVKTVRARASFLDSNTLELTQDGKSVGKVTFKHAIIATGSSPIAPPMFRIDDERVMDSTGALELKDVPKRFLIIGGGIIGLELGQVYAALGSAVTVVEMLPGIATGADRDLIKPLQKRLEADFEAIHVNTKVNSLKATRGGIEAEIEGDGVKSPQTFDRVLVCVGRRPNSANMGLENTNVEVDERGFIPVDLQRRTSEAHIFAIGDVNGNPMLAHKATREAKVAVGSILGEPEAFDPAAIPSVIYTDPEVAWCGITEIEAKENDIPVKVTKFPWAASGRAKAIDRPEGLTKILFDPDTDRIIGMGIVGPGAGELIAEGVLAVETAALARDMASTIHAHPTLSETLMESAESAFAQATHVYRPKRN